MVIVMITKMQEKVMKKIKCNLSIAKKLIRIVETLQIAAQLKTTYALADKEWNKRNGRYWYYRRKSSNQVV
jgi:hypothetical protein